MGRLGLPDFLLVLAVALILFVTFRRDLFR
jgi:Sec-independent protein translocase protein TatA